MKKSLLSLLIGSICCCSFMSNKVYSSNSVGGLSRSLLEKLYKRSIKVDDKITGIDWRHNRVFLKNENDSESLGEKELNKLKGSSFVPSHKKVVKVDSEKELVYYEKD